ncbi:MAG: glycosyltransferase family 4 protein [Pseudomonadota bacterium]
MKPPDHSTPSGDRTIARLTFVALRLAGAEPHLASRLVLRDGAGDPERQAALIDAATQEAERLIAAYRPAPPDAWLTYHSYYKAPDLLGPRVTGALGLPYAISEPSVSPRRRIGPWAAFAEASDRALAAADRLFWTTERDRPALEAAGHGARLHPLPAFIEVRPAGAMGRPAQTPARLLTVAMMRPGDKAESYRRLAAALPHLHTDWRLQIVGDGPEADAIRALFAPVADRVMWLGAIDQPEALRALYAGADALVWPGVGEGVGLVWLEAQAAAVPVVAEDGPAARSLVAGRRVAPAGDPISFARAIERALADRPDLSRLAWEHVSASHSLKAAARTLGRWLDAVPVQGRIQ